MRTCRKCGKEYRDGAELCVKDGTHLEDEDVFFGDDVNPAAPSSEKAPRFAVVVVAGALAFASGCSDPAANATVLDLTVKSDAELALDQLRIAIAVDGGAAFDPVTLPEPARPLAPEGETVEVILPDDVGGGLLRVTVEGLASGEARAESQGEVEAVRGARVALTLALALAAGEGEGEGEGEGDGEGEGEGEGEGGCGDGIIDAGEGCDDTGSAGGDGCSALCTREAGFVCNGEPSACEPGCVIDGVDVLEGSPDPVNPCRACLPAIDAASYTSVDDGSACADDTFCDGIETCVGGACVDGTAPCSATEPLCVEAADLCTCDGSSCDNGLFCDGAESCGADGACVPGSPPSCAAPTDVCSDTRGGCVTCDDDSDCADDPQNPACFTGTNICTPCPDCPCRAGLQDGGDGVCVCSPGFDRGFADLDGDGVGAGPLLDDCSPVPFGNGVSAVDTDCDDGDDEVFQLATVFYDDDLDGFTVELAVDECVGATLPQNLQLTASNPPFVSFAAATAVEQAGTGDITWDDVDDVFKADEDNAGNEVAMDSGDSTDPLHVTNFDLRVPSTATVRGVVVHIKRRAESGGSGAPVDRTVELVRDGGDLSPDNKHGTVPWTTTYEEITYGGPADLWGFGSLTPAEVNFAGFGVRFVVGTTSGSSSVDFDVDHIWIEVFTDVGGDCDDADDTVWTLRSSFVDADDDDFESSAGETERCMGTVVPAGVNQRSRGVDCFDTNDDARPDQTLFHSLDRGDGSFDYDCDGNNGTDTDRSPNVTSNLEARSCSCNTGAGTCLEASTGSVSVGGCGSTFSDDFCSDNGQCVIGGADVGCSLTEATTTVLCR